jgi:hypothetical protein
MQKELLTQDTAVGCPTYCGLWDTGTGNAICVHVKPFHSPAYVWTPVDGGAPSKPMDMQKVELTHETDIFVRGWL